MTVATFRLPFALSAICPLHPALEGVPAWQGGSTTKPALGYQHALVAYSATRGKRKTRLHCLIACTAERTASGARISRRFLTSTSPDIRSIANGCEASARVSSVD